MHHGVAHQNEAQNAHYKVKMADGPSVACVSEHKWTKSLGNVPFLSQAIIETWAKDFNLSKRLLIKGYGNSVELYIHNVEGKKKLPSCFLNFY